MTRSVRISVIAALVVHSLSETACRLFAALTPEFIRNCTPYSVFVVRCRQTRKNRNIRRKTSKSIYQRYAFHKRLRQKTRRLCGLLLQRECYTNQYMLEIESLSALQSLEVGQSVMHSEHWTLNKITHNIQ